MTSIKIAYIGGGSKHWAKVMMQDLALSENLSGEVALYDIDHVRSANNAKLGAKIFGHEDAISTFEVKAYQELTPALQDADFVFISVLPGPLPCFGNDLDIPAKHGFVQTVGDTIGPGGLSRCLRTVPIFAGFAEAIQATCPDAWVINYTNPMTVATQTLTAVAPELKTIGCCHEVFGTRSWIVGMAAEYYDIPTTHRNDLEIEVVGLNHFTFFPKARYHGKDALPAVQAWIDKQDDYFGDKTANALKRESKGRYGSCDGLIQLDFLRRFNVIGAAGDRHLVEFVPWYCQSEEHLRRYGVSITGSAQRLKNWKPDNVETVDENFTNLKRSGEEGIDLVEALIGHKEMVTNVNVPNQGQIPWLPTDHVVETMARVSHDDITPHSISAGFPLALQTHLKRIADVQAMTLEASLTCNRDLAIQALMADPLCAGDPDRVVAMLDELNEANKEWLPADWFK